MIVEMEKIMRIMTSKRQQARVLRCLGAQLLAGIPLVKALGPAAQTFPEFKTALDIVQKRLDNATDSHDPFGGLYEFFASVVPIIISLGCRGGQLENSFMMASNMLHTREKFTNGEVPPALINEMDYYRLIGFLLQCDYPLLPAMDIVAEEYLPFGEVRASVKKPLIEGESITVGLKAHPDLFSAAGISFMSIGEQMGMTPHVCEVFAECREMQLSAFLALSDCDPRVRLSRSEAVMEYGHLRFLLNATEMSIERMLTVLSETAAYVPRRMVYQEMANQVKGGQALGDAMESFPEHFPLYAAKMVQKAKNNEELAVVLANVRATMMA